MQPGCPSNIHSERRRYYYPVCAVFGTDRLMGEPLPLTEPDYRQTSYHHLYTRPAVSE